MIDVTTEYKTLAALRSSQNHHLVWKLTEDLFTDNRIELFQAYREALQKYGRLGVDELETVYGKSLPDEIIVPLDRDTDALVERLQKASTARKMYDLGQDLINASKRGEGLTERLRSVWTELEKPPTTDASLQSGLSEFLGDFGSKYRGEYQYLSTGLPFLDNMMGGEWCRREFSMITGKSGGGKSAIMGNSSLAMAQRGTPVLIFSLEMPKSMLIARWIAQLSEVDARMIRSGRESLTRPISADKIERINAAANVIKELPIHIIDMPGLDANMMRGIIVQHVKEYGIKAVFVDYLQIMGFEYGLGKHYGLSAGLLTLVQVVKEYDLAGIMLAQRHADDKRIKDCGDAIQHVAVHIDIDMEATQDELGVQIANLEYHKNRHGPLGKTSVLYHGKHLSFIGNSQ